MSYEPITLAGLAKLNEHDEIGKVLDWLTQSGEIRDYDDEIANRIEDAKTIVRGVVALSNEASWKGVRGPRRRRKT